MTTKTATILVRTEPEIKQKADQIFARIGMTTSGATNIFLHQVVQDGGLPFKPRVATKPDIPDMNELSKEEILGLLAEGEEDIKAGRVQPAEEVFAELRAEYGF